VPTVPGADIGGDVSPPAPVNRDPRWEAVFRPETLVDPTTIGPPTPGRGVGTSPAPSAKPAPAKPAPQFFGLALPLLSITKQRKLRPQLRSRPAPRPPALTPFQPPTVSLPGTPVSTSRPSLPAPLPFAGFLPTASAAPSDGGGKCFFPKKGGRRGKCRQGYFRESATGVEFTTWSTRKCPR